MRSPIDGIRRVEVAQDEQELPRIIEEGTGSSGKTLAIADWVLFYCDADPRVRCLQSLTHLQLPPREWPLPMLSKPKNRKIAAILAFSGTLIPISGLHKFYLGQPLWGVLYVLLSWTPIPRVASAIEGFWYLVQDPDEFNQNFNLGAAPTISSTVNSEQVSAIADALRQLDRLRQEGLMSEYEFEQKRRQLLDRMI